MHKLLYQFLVLLAVYLAEFRYHLWSAFIAALERDCAKINKVRTDGKVGIEEYLLTSCIYGNENLFHLILFRSLEYN